MPRAVYINLNRRQDRRVQVESEFRRLGRMSVVRFQAIENEIGLLGAAESHLSVLKEAQRDNGGPILIFEDDIQFHCTAEELMATINEFLGDQRLDVLNLSPTFYGKPWPISRRLAVGNNIRAAAAYLVKPDALAPLIARFESSLLLMRNAQNPHVFAYDSLWEQDQKKTLLFSVPRKRLITQRPSYSDLQDRNVDYYSS